MVGVGPLPQGLYPHVVKLWIWFRISRIPDGRVARVAAALSLPASACSLAVARVQAAFTEIFAGNERSGESRNQIRV